ncbi:hypothetical protein [Stenotrophomonas sp.]|uniref:hypothetical protein n=1 Tax=Stenotrophomonas sp. TaxID=69392 RepID=UPI002FCB15DA
MPTRSLRLHRQTALPLLVLLSLSSTLVACTDAGMTPVYPQSMVEPVSVEKRSATEIAVRYKVRPETRHYAGGVDFERVGDALRIVIKRCTVGSACAPMAKSVIPLDDRWQGEVHLPFDAARVVMVSADGERQVYP